MKKLKRVRKFNRGKDQRKALLKALMTALFLHEKIKTTEAKAKELSRVSGKIITRAKKDDFNTKRYLAKTFASKIVKKLTAEIGPRYKDRNGGYTRVIKLGQRLSDGARMAIIELVK